MSAMTDAPEVLGGPSEDDGSAMPYTVFFPVDGAYRPADLEHSAPLPRVGDTVEYIDQRGRCSHYVVREVIHTLQLAAVLGDDLLAGPRRAQIVLRGPQRELLEQRAKVLALRREPVIAALALHDARRLERAEARSEPLRRDPDREPLEVGEALGPGHKVAHDVERPALAEQLE